MNEALLKPVQDARTNPTLEFRDGQCMLTCATQGGTKIEQLISWEAVREAATKIPVTSGWLTSEIVNWGTGGRGEWCAAFIAPARHELELTNGTPGVDEVIERVTAPLPGLVFFGHGSKYFVWAQKTPKCEPHHEVFRCPLPNVMEDASICWGLLKPPTASPRTIMKAWELFIRSSFNNHAANGKSKALATDDIRDVLRACSRTEEAYPTDDLMRQVARTGVTLDQAIRGWFDVSDGRCDRSPSLNARR